MINDLGDWLKRRLKKGVQEQSFAAQAILDHCELSIFELQKQWSDQRAAQLSIRARTSFICVNGGCLLNHCYRCTCPFEERT